MCWMINLILGCVIIILTNLLSSFGWKPNRDLKHQDEVVFYDSELFPDLTGLPGWYSDWTSNAVKTRCPNGTTGSRNYQPVSVWVVDTRNRKIKKLMNGPNMMLANLDYCLLDDCPGPRRKHYWYACPMSGYYNSPDSQTFQCITKMCALKNLHIFHINKDIINNISLTNEVCFMGLYHTYQFAVNANWTGEALAEDYLTVPKQIYKRQETSLQIAKFVLRQLWDSGIAKMVEREHAVCNSVAGRKILDQLFVAVNKAFADAAIKFGGKLGPRTENVTKPALDNSDVWVNITVTNYVVKKNGHKPHAPKPNIQYAERMLNEI